MPRSNRPRGRREGEEPEPLDLARVLGGVRRTERKRDGSWNVQPQSAASSVKITTCPGCGLEIAVGTAHLVAWRADGLFGEEDDLRARRHWHPHCWRIRP
ncbi:hypothetical protein [Homoserinibacter sp. YIM 151385]|uniref:hypothetical protein n=1 Tax=Homoserinibacter sp. YIM 151385 TaxID=2985506 RepID=UPI0022EFE710|nr:hypothetical protein [Homoserinibacter sp. YIM 151385]WBU39156.1 hypothetical protein OF852_06165 [Homoserinibacter sp. YIM 151385]